MQLDKEIKELVAHLNRAGFQTYYSCAGHPGDEGTRGDRGCIQIVRCPRGQREALRDICRWHNLKGIKIRDVKMSPYGLEQGIKEGTQVTFDPVGLTVKQRVAQLGHKKIPMLRR